MDEFENYLCSELKNYQDVIIYGYADIGTCILDYIIDFETSIKIANYSGRVRYFAYSQKNRDSLRKEIKGIKLKSIYELQEYSKLPFKSSNKTKQTSRKNEKGRNG